MELKDFFEIDHVTGDLISKHYRHGAGPAGHKVGYHNNKGYLCFWHKGKRYTNHRVIWEILNGKIPDGLHIDHINGVRDDNRISNLRLVKNNKNCQNRKLQHNNSTGIHGVYLHKRNNRYCVQISSKSDARKCYLGSFDNIFDAACARKSAENELGYHPNHGRPE
ncbi:HNH endonuclease [Yersinia ruckeri]|uniref:HNH endonuclease signature motif containing protein n=1 Tax=Yersinia ruckeri TaxID=29486 RepID=UPI00091494ED|nr:HNH endonuclease signature motif containing protein [Yersinia ruckeri]MCW6525288.1 HNH endonuclease [Yersinia ruckeri]MCW6592926.1 HNH endonuclease [Yersinia ruckeri]MCW6605585.1 HNH endonuclease [Yersinia ruckeri]OIX43805.1 hypothetical protein AXW22_17100 [Yersinia ruckeri]OJC86736.1 hypothetical protein AXW45_17675 [Yersinia ruckeri]